MPLLSVCIPTYNRSKWLEASLKAWGPQVRGLQGLVELWVCDNCSTDQTAEVVSEMRKTTDFEYRRNDSNLGAIGNIDRLVRELAQGEYVWVVGDDDIVCEGALRTIVDALQANRDIQYFNLNYYSWISKTPGEILNVVSLKEGDLILGHKDVNNRRVLKTADLIAGDTHCFTRMYSSIVHHDLYQNVFQDGAQRPAFTSLSSTFPHAEFIVSHLLEQPAFYIGQPLIIASEEISWRESMPISVLHWLPSLYDLAERHGADRAMLDRNRREVLRHAHEDLSRILFHRGTKQRKLFSFWTFFFQHARFMEFWHLLVGMMKKVAYEATPSPIRQSWGRLKQRISVPPAR